MTASELPTLRVSFVRRLAYWLEPRWRDPGWLAFALNRLTGHILILYLILHMVVLSQLLDGAEWLGPAAGPVRIPPVPRRRHAAHRRDRLPRTEWTPRRCAHLRHRSAPHHTCSILLVLGATTILTALAGWAILT